MIKNSNSIFIFLMNLSILIGCKNVHTTTGEKSKIFWGEVETSSECYMHQKEVCVKKFRFWKLINTECKTDFCS